MVITNVEQLMKFPYYLKPPSLMSQFQLAEEESTPQDANAELGSAKAVLGQV